jgi:F-type H+-transporting ATPase subunit a
MAEGHGSHNPLAHAMDQPTLELPWGMNGWVIQLPEIDLGFFKFQLTRFMVTEAIVALFIIAVMIPVARSIAKRPVTRGALANAFEAIILFIRDKIARPSIGDHGADDFLPYLLTVFFFVLFNNLFGLVPGGASATGNINVTIILACATMLTVIMAGMKETGPVQYWIKLVPTMDVPKVLKIFLWPLMFVIELMGLFIRHFVLAIRLFANMLAGHVVLGVILGFILMASGGLVYLVTPASVLGVVLLSFLELLVAFLQAYIFTLLSALFIGSAVHPH